MKQRKDLSVAEKHHIVQFLSEGSKDGHVTSGRRAAVVVKFSSSPRTISRIWAAAKEQKKNGQLVSLQYGKLKKRGKNVQIDLELIASLEMGQRSSIRRLANGVNCSKSEVGRWVQEKLIKAHTNAIRPELTAPNKLERLKFSLHALELDAILNTLRFKSMDNIVHIDEKWFNMTKAVKRFYIIPGETEPHRTCKSKKFITKVMFMCAVCRPLFGPDGNLIFDGKIGIFPFTEQVPAKRKSKNRPAGTMETKSVISVTKEVVRDCIINEVCKCTSELCSVCQTPLIGVQLVSCYEM